MPPKHVPQHFARINTDKARHIGMNRRGPGAAEIADVEAEMAGEVVIQASPTARPWLARLRPRQRTEWVGYLFIMPYLIAFVLFPAEKLSAQLLALSKTIS